MYRYVNTEITPGISQDAFRNVLLAVRASMRKVLRKHDALGSSCGSSWRPYVRLQTLFAEAPAKKSLQKGLWKQDFFEVPTKRELVFAEALQKLAGERVVISKEVNKE